MATDPDTLIPLADTEERALADLLKQLGGLTGRTLSWASGAIPFTLLRLFAKGYADFTGALRDVAKGMMVRYSRGEWLDFLLDWFATTRAPATVAVGTVRLDVAPGSGPHTIPPGQAWMREAVRGLRYSSANDSPVTLPAGPSSTVVSFRAESAGAAYAIPLGTGVSLINPPAGVTATLVDTTSAGTWLTTPGADAEQDAVALARGLARWDSLGLLRPREAYLRLARETPGLSELPTRLALVGGARGPGTIDVWFAGPTGPLPTVNALAIQTWLRAAAGPNDDLQAGNAPVLAVDVAADVGVVWSHDGALDQAKDRLRALINDTPLGGEVQRSDVIREITAVTGIDKVEIDTVKLNGVAADLDLTGTQVAVVGDLQLRGFPVD